MNIPNVPVKITPLVACMAMFLMAASYMVFLYASWQGYQKERLYKHDAIDQLLARFPQAKAEPDAA